MDKEWTIIEILRHSRHDWLNKIQLIKGNLDLDKVDRVKRIIDEIVIEAQHESRITSMKMPGFAELLLTANWGKNPFRLEFEVISANPGGQSVDRHVTDWTSNLFRLLKDALDFYGENVLSLTIFQRTEEILCFSFDLQGTIKNEELLKSYIENSENQFIKTQLTEITDREALFRVEIRD
ncbi:Spo0B C-terminal domain-containing protein [Peribacillus sp. SCS-155]|uniref:Spo0B C-terminal domain-containing protein n=1 Tax=Peribacillus sedimenti TaxID=3115297 RepID=UPI0039057641